MANYELVEGENGDPYDTLIYDKNKLDTFGNPQLISFSAKGITQATLYIAATTNFENNPLKTITLTLPNDYTVRWNVQAGDIPPATGISPSGDYYAQIVMKDVSGNIVRKTYDILTVKVKPKLGAP